MKVQKLSLVNTFLVSLLVAAALFCWCGQARADQEGDFTYTISDGEATIEGYSGLGGDVAIPSTLGGVPVTSIGSRAFEGCSTMKQVLIPDSVEDIGMLSFLYCSGLSDITIPDSVTNIGVAAFAECTGLNSINLGQGITNIPNTIYSNTGSYYRGVFEGCNKLSSVTIPDNVTYIGSRAFKNCTSLTNLDLGRNVAVIGGMIYYENALPISGGAFTGCTNLTNVILSDSVTYIGAGAFDGCIGLTAISIPDSVTGIDDYAFKGCRNLTNVTLGNSITDIGNYAFASTGIAQIDIPDSVVNIGIWAFSGTNLSNVTIPGSVKYIGDCAFRFCALNQINVDTTNLFYSSRDGVLFNHNQTRLIKFPPAKTGSYSIPDSVTDISKIAFEDCSGLDNVVFPEGLTNIESRAFRNCYGLKNVILPRSLKTLQGAAFETTSLITSMETIQFNSADTQITYVKPDPYPNQGNTIQRDTIILGYDPSTAKDYATAYGHTFKGITGIYLTKSSLTANDIEINGQGVGYAYFKLIEVTDGVTTPLANRTITYSYSGYGDSYITTSDNDGEIVFKTPSMYESQSLTLNIQSISGISDPVESQTIDVQVAEVSFKEEWEGTVGIGAGAEVGIGVGGAIGIAEAEAEIAGVGLKANSKPSMIVKNSYDNGKRSLEITNKLSSEVAASAKVGLFGEVDVAGADLGINIAGIKGEATYGANAGIGLKIDEYDPNNIDHASKVAVYLLNDALTAPGATTGANVVTAKLLELININVYDTTSYGTKVKLGGGAEIGSFEVEGYEPVKLVGGTATTTFAYDTVQESNGNSQYETGYKTEGKISVADFGYIPPIFSIGSLSKDVSLTANHGLTEQSLELETAGENNPIEILWYEESNGEKTKFQFSGEDYTALYNGNNNIKNFCDGSKGYFSIPDWGDTFKYIYESQVSGTYSVSTEKAKGVDVELPFKLKAFLGLEIILYSSGLDTVAFDTENGVLNDGRAYKQSESFDIDGLVNANRLPLTTILVEPIVTLGNIVGDFVSKVGASIVEGVQNGAAAVVGVVNDVSNRIVNIFRITTPFGMQKSYVIMALPNEYSLLSETYVAVTVGEPYIVMVTDADGIEISEFEPLTLEISYDDTMLATAGIAADSTLIDRMKIYYWDEEKATYLNRGGMLDKVNKKVTLEITKGGQYILAIDNLGPDISNFIVSNHTATPSLSAYVTDLSGIDESTFRFSIDDNTLVNGDSFTDYFNYSTGKFSYQVQEPLSEGEHTASIIVDDTSGNALPQAAILQFTVDTQPPTIVEVNIPDAIIAGEELAITATTSEADRVSVCIAYPIGEGWSDFETLSMTSPSENIWNTIIRNTSVSNRLKLKVLVYDAADNVSASPEVIVNIAPPVSGYTLSGQVLVEGDDLTEGQTHYSGGVTIELKQGEEIKYSTTSSEAADLASNGSFSLTGIAAGDYTVVISKAGYLTRSFNLTINSDLTLSTTSNQYLNRIYLLAGDIVSDEYNVIAAADVNYILSKFNSNSTQAGFDPQVDIVKDQYNVISAADVNLMLSNFNKNSTQYPADIIY